MTLVISLLPSLLVFGGKFAVATLAAATTLRYFFRSKAVSEKAHARMVQDLIQLRKTADDDLRVMTNGMLAALQRRTLQELEMKDKMTSLEAKMADIEKFIPHLMKLASKFNSNLESLKSRVKTLSPEAVLVETRKKDDG